MLNNMASNGEHLIAKKDYPIVRDRNVLNSHEINCVYGVLRSVDLRRVVPLRTVCVSHRTRQRRQSLRVVPNS